MLCEKPDCDGEVYAYGRCDINTENGECVPESASYDRHDGGYCAKCGEFYDCVGTD